VPGCFQPSVRGRQLCRSRRDRLGRYDPGASEILGKHPPFQADSLRCQGIRSANRHVIWPDAMQDQSMAPAKVPHMSQDFRAIAEMARRSGGGKRGDQL
jgi:hypothetical protein